MAESGRAHGSSWRGRIGGWRRVRGVVGVVADAVGLLLGLGRVDGERGELLGGRRGDGARRVGACGELVVDGVVLRLGDDIGVDQEFELLPYLLERAHSFLL